MPNLIPTTLDAVKPGDHVSVDWAGDSGAGYSGTVVSSVYATLVTTSGTAHYRRSVPYAEIGRVMLEVPFDADECLDYDADECKGEVDYGYRGWLRCTFHNDRRLDRMESESSMERYADSDLAPDWLDPSYAGERWSEDD